MAIAEHGTLVARAKRVGRWRLSAVTLLLSVPAFSLALSMPWEWSVALVLAIAVHEMSHVAVLACHRAQWQPPVFIPLLGAFITFDPGEVSPTVRGWVALGGPVGGVVVGLLALGLHSLLGSGSTTIYVFGIANLWLSLLNLIPVLPLDGGRILQALNPSWTPVGWPVLAVVGPLWLGWWTLLLVLLCLFSEWAHAGEEHRPATVARWPLVGATVVTAAAAVIALA